MNNLKEYLLHCLNSIFQNWPTDQYEIVERVKDVAINNAIIDVNIKYLGRLKVETESELIELVQLEPTVEAVLLYRIEREIFLIDKANALLPYLASMMHRRTGCEIYYSTEIGKGFNIQHGFGIIIGPRYSIGNNFTIHQGVTLGQKVINSPNERIIIGDNVTIFAGAIVLGDITIGDNSSIAANAVVLKDVTADSIFGGVPAKLLKMN